jgi:uncharacterized membrane protein YoaK (UPF0700 family)
MSRGVGFNPPKGAVAVTTHAVIQNQLPMAETKLNHFEFILILTAFAAGSVDIISFAKLGGIFASAMTGNLALFGLYVARGSIFSALGALIALIGFIGGVSTGSLLTRDRLHQKALTILLAAQTILLFAAAILWLTLSHRSGRPSADLLILILAIAMGLQAVAGKTINLSSIPTIVFTSTLTNIVISVTDLLARGKFSLPADTKRQIAAFCAYFTGAVIAGLLSFFDFSIVIVLPLLAIVICLGVHIRETAG